MARSYALGRRQAAVDRTAGSILQAARDLLSAEPRSVVSVAAIARKAGCSRITVYNRFGSREGLIRALTPSTPPVAPARADAREALHTHLEGTCVRWAANPGLYRRLAPGPDEAAGRELAERLAASDLLRPGCSLREAEDVIVALSSFPVFDRLYKDGRRTSSSVAEILMRLAAGILA